MYPQKLPQCSRTYASGIQLHALNQHGQWGRDSFEEHFRNGPENVNKYLTQTNFLEDLKKQGVGEMKLTLTTITNNVVKERCTSFEDCIKWARFLFQEYFHNAILQLLFNFPLDAKDSRTGGNKCSFQL